MMREEPETVDLTGFVGGCIPPCAGRTLDASMIVARRLYAFPAWTEDEAFMRIVNASMPAVYERYRDPDNRAKGEPDLTAKDAIDYLVLAAYEAIEVLNEWKKHREGKGDPAAILHELSDMTLTGMFAAACWDDMVRKMAVGVYAEQAN